MAFRQEAILFFSKTKVTAHRTCPNLLHPLVFLMSLASAYSRFANVLGFFLRLFLAHDSMIDNNNYDILL